MRIRFITSATLVAGLSASAMAGPIVYDFKDNDAFDKGGSFGTTAGAVGSTASATDGTTAVAITTVDVQCPQYGTTTPFAATGVMLSAAGRAGFTQADVRTATITGVNSTQMGIDNPSISDANAATAGLAASSEAGNINPGEAWVFKFDKDVTFTQMNLVSIDPGDVVTVTVGNLGTFTLTDPTTDTADDFNDPFGGLVIPAGTEITFKNTSTAANSVERIDAFTVTPTPEPATLAAAGLGGLLLARRRRI